jgi:uncharacterized membrane protein YhhN
MTTTYPVYIVLILAVLDWIAVYKKIKVMEYIFKPVTMLGILFWIWQSTGFDGSMLWFTIGVVFCLAGDVFLMLPGDRFIYGLLAFLFGQMSYILGFSSQPPYINLWGAALVIFIGIYIAWLYPKLAGSLKSKSLDKLRIPVLIYTLVISLMVYSALMTWTRPDWDWQAALAASLGALFFYSSDSILAWDRFVNPISEGRLKTMITYHLGQIGIILGAILFSSQ